MVRIASVALATALSVAVSAPTALAGSAKPSSSQAVVFAMTPASKPQADAAAKAAAEKAATVAKEKAEADAAQAKAAKEKAESDAANAKAAKEKAESQAAAQQAAKEKAEADTAQAKAANEKAESDAADAKVAKEKADLDENDNLRDHDPKVVKLGEKISLLTTDCDLTQGCLFSGNDNDPAAISRAYVGVFPLRELNLALRWKIEGDDVEGASGSWNFADGVRYISVKAGPEFMLYQLPQGTTFGTWTTAGLDNRRGILHSVSHVTLWDSPAPASLGAIVPEPAAWALMILGFGGVGALLRRRRSLGLSTTS